jgi:hypothetical protein
MKQLAYIVGLFAVIPGQASAQQPPSQPSPEYREAMKSLDFLVGRWKGEATYESGGGKSLRVSQSETVESRLNGAVLIIEGRGTMKTGEREVVVHNALAVISFDEKTKKFRFKAHRGNGMALDANLEMKDGVFVWGYDDGKGTIRYTIRKNDKGQLHEIGERSTDGKEWKKFLEMTLDRVKE